MTAGRSRYLVAYDIRDPTRLRQVHKTVRSYGEPLQYSVFVCDLTHSELCQLRTELRDTAHLAVDSVMFVPLGDGYDPGCFEFMGVAPSLPTDSAIVF